MGEEYYWGETLKVNKVLILVEGQSEETFVKEVLAPHLSDFGVEAVPTLVIHKFVKRGSANLKGGIFDYEVVKRHLYRLLQDSKVKLVTTMIDFYGLPDNFPGQKDLPIASSYSQVEHLEKAFEQDIGYQSQRFSAYLQLHEFEAMLFVAPDKMAQVFPGSDSIRQIAAVKLADIKKAFGSPEEINNNKQTAPSKRILSLFLGYEKPLYGTLIALDIGLDLIRSECSHFNQWLTKLEGLGTI